MELDTLTNKLEINYFPMNQAQEAVQSYNHMESLQVHNLNTVLVSASSFNTLKRAYPNYFLERHAIYLCYEKNCYETSVSFFYNVATIHY